MESGGCECVDGSDAGSDRVTLPDSLLAGCVVQHVPATGTDPVEDLPCFLALIRMHFGQFCSAGSPTCNVTLLTRTLLA